MHVGTYVEMLTRSHSAPTAMQNLAAIRMLFDWLVTGKIVPTNPAGDQDRLAVASSLRAR